jgi:DNA modification methylase
MTVIRRALQIWSNPNDIIFSPFGGIGSEPYVALEQGRRTVAIELKPEYYEQMVKNIAELTEDDNQITLSEFSY